MPGGKRELELILFVISNPRIMPCRSSNLMNVCLMTGRARGIFTPILRLRINFYFSLTPCFEGILIEKPEKSVELG